MREAEILKSVTTAWAAVTNSATLLPGGLHEFAAEDDNVPNDPSTGRKAEVYATMNCVEQAIKTKTTGGVVREHILTISVKNNGGLNACASILEAMASTTTGIPANMAALDNSGYLIHMLPHNSSGGTTDNHRAGNPIVAAEIAWKVMTSWPY